MKKSLKNRKSLVLELEENNCKMKLLTPSFLGFETVFLEHLLPVKFAAVSGRLLSTSDESKQKYIGNEIVETSGNN